MLVSDLALREDDAFSKIAESWVDDFPALTNAFAAAWFKLIHRDMGKHLPQVIVSQDWHTYDIAQVPEHQYPENQYSPQLSNADFGTDRSHLTLSRPGGP